MPRRLRLKATDEEIRCRGHWGSALLLNLTSDRLKTSLPDIRLNGRVSSVVDKDRRRGTSSLIRGRGSSLLRDEFNWTRDELKYPSSMGYVGVTPTYQYHCLTLLGEPDAWGAEYRTRTHHTNQHK